MSDFWPARQCEHVCFCSPERVAVALRLFCFDERCCSVLEPRRRSRFRRSQPIHRLFVVVASSPPSSPRPSLAPTSIAQCALIKRQSVKQSAEIPRESGLCDLDADRRPHCPQQQSLGGNPSRSACRTQLICTAWCWKILLTATSRVLTFHWSSFPLGWLVRLCLK